MYREKRINNLALKRKDVNITIYDSETNEKVLSDEIIKLLPVNNDMRILIPSLTNYLKSNIFIGNKIKNRYVVVENKDNIEDVLAFDIYSEDNKLKLKERKVIPREKIKMVSGSIKICMPISDLQKLKEFDKEIEEQYSKLVLNILRTIEVPKESKVVHRLDLDDRFLALDETIHRVDETTHDPKYGL